MMATIKQINEALKPLGEKLVSVDDMRLNLTAEVYRRVPIRRDFGREAAEKLLTERGGLDVNDIEAVANAAVAACIDEAKLQFCRLVRDGKLDSVNINPVLESLRPDPATP
jgi:hypothetical protein